METGKDKVLENKEKISISMKELEENKLKKLVNLIVEIVVMSTVKEIEEAYENRD